MVTILSETADMWATCDRASLVVNVGETSASFKMPKRLFWHPEFVRVTCYTSQSLQNHIINLVTHLAHKNACLLSA